MPLRIMLAFFRRCRQAVESLLAWVEVLPSRELPRRTISVGSLTDGERGKTSAAVLAAETVAALGDSAAIACRDSPPAGRDPLVLEPGETPPEWIAGGDAWLGRRIPGSDDVPVVASRRVWTAGIEACRKFKPGAVVLDDAFEHRSIRRDLDILLIDAEEPFGDGRLAPWGSLIAPVRAVRRAQVALITGVDRVPEEDLRGLRETLVRERPDLVVVESVFRPSRLLDLGKGRERPLSWLKGRHVVTCTSAGRPRSFEDGVRGLGADIDLGWRLAPREAVKEADLERIGRRRDGQPLVMGLKESGRLPEGWRRHLSGDVLELSFSLKIVGGRAAWERELAPSVPVRLAEPGRAVGEDG